ncbi:MAG: hypothetical protein HY727_00705 [Candidatus Rokubacteria bacterium]|nr:hypothetical protein [Candidatus Rokubacteria bacterium]
MTETHDHLLERFGALRERFSHLAAGLADVARGLQERGSLPSGTVVDEAATARRDFADLRTAVLDLAGSLSVPPPATVVGLRDLEPVLRAALRAEETRAKRHAFEEARQSALTILDRVLAIVHQDEAGFAPLLACQAKAREQRAALADLEGEPVDYDTNLFAEKTRAYGDLLILAEGWDVLDDSRCAVLQDTLTQVFGRPLAVAALRGKFVSATEAAARIQTPAAARPPGPRAEPRSAAPPGQPASMPWTAEPVAPAAAAGAPPVAGGVPRAAEPVGQAGSDRPGMSPPAPGIGPPGGAPPAGAVIQPGGAFVQPMGAGISIGVPQGTPSPTTGPVTQVPLGPMVGGPQGPLVLEIRLTGDKVSVGTPEERREKEQLLERLASETAQWWIGAREGWTALKDRNLAFAEAAREELAKFPYLLSVPIQKSTGYEDGRLAEGYSLLLAHIEKQEEGFVNEALMRLNPQFTTRAEDQSYPLGQELYLYIVAEGRLYKTYPDFIKDVLASALPNPGFWTQAAIVETESETRLLVRPGAEVGETELETHALTDAAERATHTFSVPLGPLTTRFFTVEASNLEEPRDVEVKLMDGDVPTDRAWLVTLPAEGKLSPRKHRPAGTALPALGKEYQSLWIAVFNSDPNAEKRYELTVSLKRKAPPPSAKTAKAEADKPSLFGKPSPFAPKKGRS